MRPTYKYNQVRGFLASTHTILTNRASTLTTQFIYREKQGQIKGPDNPTCQLLPIMGNKCCSGTGKAGKTKEVVEDREVKQVVCEELCVTKLYVKDGV